MSGSTICILGGSSPFTAGLVDSLLPVAARFSGPTLWLHGRSADNLAIVARYAEHQLGRYGWQVRQSTSMNQALEAADIVIHQIRYGGLDGRADGEQLSHKLGILADETLGPAALLTAIRTIPDLSGTCQRIVESCPNAWVLNLTNPLSAITSAMIQFGVQKCVGLCELPMETQQTALRFFDDALEDVSWTYAGLNHRGFIDTLQTGQRNLLDELPDRMGEQTIGGIRASEIHTLNAIPLKYFRLVHEPPSPETGRANFLSSLRDQVLAELKTSCEISPPSMQRRYMEWYPKSVVPMLSSLCCNDPGTHVVNIVGEDGIVVEAKAAVQGGAVRPMLHKSANPNVSQWNATFEQHERSFVRAMLEPSPTNIQTALVHDPLTPDAIAAKATTALSTAIVRSDPPTHTS